MDWAVISGMADTVAAFGVIGSLIFVGYSVRQNSKGQRYAAVQTQTASFQAAVTQLVSTPDAAEILWQGSQNPEKLEGASRLRFDVLVNNMFRAGQSIHWEWQHGVFDNELFSGLATGFQNFAALPGIGVVWDSRRDNFTSDYQAFIDGLIVQSGGNPNIGH